jgi:hypothetical protein
MREDDVLREVRMNRDGYCRQFGYDLGAIVRDLRKQEQAEGRQVVTLPARRPVRQSREGVRKSA